MNSYKKTLVRRTLRWGLVASLLLHAGLLIVMFIGSVGSWLDARPLHVIQASAVYARVPETDGVETATVVINENDAAPAGLQQHVDASLAANEQLSEAERMEALDQAADRLRRISSEASLNDVAQRLQSWLGLRPRAERPAAPEVADADPADGVGATPDLEETPGPADVQPPAPAEPTFDFETAQLHSIERIEGADGSARYVCVMLDAAGRTMEVPLSEAEGAPIYVVMEKIKASPLLEKIYRQIAMPMIDQIVRAERAAVSAAEAARAHADTGTDDDPAPTRVGPSPPSEPTVEVLPKALE